MRAALLSQVPRRTLPQTHGSWERMAGLVTDGPAAPSIIAHARGPRHEGAGNAGRAAAAARG